MVQSCSWSWRSKWVNLAKTLKTNLSHCLLSVDSYLAARKFLVSLTCLVFRYDDRGSYAHAITDGTSIAASELDLLTTLTGNTILKYLKTMRPDEYRKYPRALEICSTVTTVSMSAECLLKHRPSLATELQGLQRQLAHMDLSTNWTFIASCSRIWPWVST